MLRPQLSDDVQRQNAPELCRHAAPPSVTVIDVSAKLILDASQETWEMRVQLDSVLMPYGQLTLRRVGIGPSVNGVPGPYLVRIELVQFLGQAPRGKVPHVAIEVSVDVVGAVFGLDEGVVHKDGADPNFPQLID